MVEKDLGQATIVYEEPDEGTVEKTVQNEHLSYFQDHWIVKTNEDEQDHDTVRRIPLQRVYYVERSVEEFEEEIKTLRDQVQSVAADVRTKILGGGGRSSGGDSDVRRIDVETDEGDESGSRSS